MPGPHNNRKTSKPGKTRQDFPIPKELIYADKVGMRVLGILQLGIVALLSIASIFAYAADEFHNPSKATDAPIISESMSYFLNDANESYSAFKAKLKAEAGDTFSRQQLALLLEERIRLQKELEKEYHALQTLSEAFEIQNPAQVPQRLMPLMNDINVLAKEAVKKLGPPPQNSPKELSNFVRNRLRIVALVEDQKKKVLEIGKASPTLDFHLVKKKDSPVIQHLVSKYKEAFEKEWSARLAASSEEFNFQDLEKLLDARIRMSVWIEKERESLLEAQRYLTDAKINSPEKAAQYLEQEAPQLRKAVLEYWHLENDPSAVSRKQFLKEFIDKKWKEILLAQEVNMRRGVLDTTRGLLASEGAFKLAFGTSLIGLGSVACGLLESYHNVMVFGFKATFAGVTVMLANQILSKTHGPKAKSSRPSQRFQEVQHRARANFDAHFGVTGECDLARALSETLSFRPPTLAELSDAMNEAVAIGKLEAAAIRSHSKPEISATKIRVGKGSEPAEPFAHIPNAIAREEAEKKAVELELEAIEQRSAEELAQCRNRR